MGIGKKYDSGNKGSNFNWQKRFNLLMNSCCNGQPHPPTPTAKCYEAHYEIDSNSDYNSTFNTITINSVAVPLSGIAAGVSVLFDQLEIDIQTTVDTATGSSSVVYMDTLPYDFGSGPVPAINVYIGNMIGVVDQINTTDFTIAFGEMTCPIPIECPRSCTDALDFYSNFFPGSPDGNYVNDSASEYFVVTGGVITDTIACVDKFITVYQFNALGPYYFDPVSSKWQPLITLFPIGSTIGCCVQYTATIPSNSIAYFEASNNGTDPFSTLGGPYTTADLTSPVNTNVSFLSYTWRLRVITYHNCEIYSAINTFTL